MRYSDSSRGRPFAKDPAVVWFRDQYWLYYSIPPFGDNRAGDGWRIGIANSSDLEKWHKVGEILPEQECESNGFCAPGACVIGNQLHLFYQTYGNGPRDAICHAYSDDGLHWKRNATNPIFSPRGDWNNGRAIDADVVLANNHAWLYFATRDPAGEIQMLGVASAPTGNNTETIGPDTFERSNWTQRCDASILKPELAWEQACIEAATVIVRQDVWWMFYGGAYNASPQQIGCAWSKDGMQWQRLSDEPFLRNGEPNSWNADESGHPFLFEAPDGRTHLFFQGTNDRGRTWHLSRVEILWRDGKPHVDI